MKYEIRISIKMIGDRYLSDEIESSKSNAIRNGLIFLGFLGLFVAIATILSWNVQRSNNLCLECGRQVVIRQTWFSWEHPRYPMKYRIEYEGPSVLSGVLQRDAPCSHGLQMGSLNGKLVGLEKKNYLLPIEGDRRGLFGDERLHWTGIGMNYSIFLLKGTHFVDNPRHDVVWKLKFAKYLAERAKAELNFRAKFQDSLFSWDLTSSSSFAALAIKDLDRVNTLENSRVKR